MCVSRECEECVWALRVSDVCECVPVSQGGCGSHQPPTSVESTRVECHASVGIAPSARASLLRTRFKPVTFQCCLLHAAAPSAAASFSVTSITPQKIATKSPVVSCALSHDLQASTALTPPLECVFHRGFLSCSASEHSLSYTSVQPGDQRPLKQRGRPLLSTRATTAPAARD